MLTCCVTPFQMGRYRLTRQRLQIIFLFRGHGEVDGAIEQAAEVTFCGVQRQRHGLISKCLEPIILISLGRRVRSIGKGVDQMTEKTTAFLRRCRLFGFELDDQRLVSVPGALWQRTVNDIGSRGIEEQPTIAKGRNF